MNTMMKILRLRLLTLMALFTAFTFSVSAETARVQIIHNSADAAAELVDVWLNQTRLIENFAFRTATSFIDAPAGVLLNIGIAPPNSTSWTQSFKIKQVVLTENQTYVVIAHGITSASGYNPSPIFDVRVYPAGREVASQEGNTDVLVVHGSTDAPTVDIYETGVGLGEIIDDMSFDQIQGYFELSTLDYVLEIRDASGQTTVVAYEAPLAALDLDGQALVVLASGFLNPANNSDGEAFGLFVALPSGGALIPLPVFEESTPETARVQIIHNSADALVSSVDIFANGEILLPGVGFRQATPFLDVPAGVALNLVVAPEGAGIENGVGPITVEFAPGETYVVVAAGNVSASGYAPEVPFSLFAYPMGREASTQPGNTDVLVFHGSTDAPTVSVWETGVGAGEIIPDFAFGDFAGYLELGTLDYVLEIRDASGQTTVVAYEAPLAALDLDGQALVVLASGFLNPANNSDGDAFGLFVALPGGGELIPLPLFEGTTNVTDISQAEFRIFPNPARDMLNIVSDEEISQIRITDMLGKVVLSMAASGSSQILNLDGMRSGIYFVQLFTELGVSTHKIQVNR